jgi:hypothetical protein
MNGDDNRSNERKGYEKLKCLELIFRYDFIFWTIIIIIIVQVFVLMESKDYKRHSETIIIPPAHVALRCDHHLPIWEQ